MQTEIPDGWTATKLGKIGRLNTSSVDKKSDDADTQVRLLNYMDVYRHSHLRSSDGLMEVTASQAEIDRFSVRRGDVLFTPSSETPDDIGHSAVVTWDEPGVLHSYHTVRLRPHEDAALDPEFSGWFMQNPEVLRYFSGRASGSTRFTLNLPDFKEAPILLPPLPEQKKIAAILASVDQSIQATEAVIEQTRRVKEGLLQDLLTRGIGHTRFKQTEIGEIPESWEVRKVQSLLADVDPAMRSGPFGSALLKSELVEHGIPLLGIDNVHVEAFKAEYKRFVAEEKFLQLQRYVVRPADVMITIMGTVGRSCLVPDDIGRALSSKHTWTLTFDQDGSVRNSVYGPGRVRSGRAGRRRVD